MEQEVESDKGVGMTTKRLAHGSLFSGIGGAELAEVAHMGLLPTPQAMDYKRMERKPSYANIGWGGSTLTDAAYQSRRMMKEYASTTAFPDHLGTPSQLNPLFWEEIMGYPVEWTLYPFLTASSDRRQ